MTAVEPKIAERRQRVTEDRARRRLRSLFVVLLLIVVGALGYWLLQSPLLSVHAIEVRGAVHSDPAAVASDVGIVVGEPTISVDEGVLLEALVAQPWIEAATIHVAWPGTVSITVVEHVPIASVSYGEVMALVAADGSVLSTVVPPGGARIATHAALPRPGRAIADGATLAAVSFVEALPAPVREQTAVTVAPEGLSAVVMGHPVRIGRPVDVVAKAAALTALLDGTLADGVPIDVVAPGFPAVGNVQPLVEGETESLTEGEPSG